MQFWTQLLAPSPDFDAWFARVATALLTQTRLVVANQPHRLAEVEVYFHGPGHEDPFAHRDPVQLHRGRWYVHRTGGSFKGIDLAFGGDGAFAGVLLRGLETADGNFIDGPSLLVDHLLKRTGTKTSRELAALLGERPAWDPACPVHLEQLPQPDGRTVYTSARVGLNASREPAFFAKPYRFLTDPRRTRKGRRQLVLGLLAAGKFPEEVRELTGSPLARIREMAAELRRHPG
jgi:3-methyladenine DNA glycosylase Mpg